MACKLLQVDISGPWCTKDKTRTFELGFSLATVTKEVVQLLGAGHSG
jgi:hypothetical protein